MTSETGTINGSRICNCNKTNTKLKTPEDQSCPWWINSKKHKFCFWTYISQTSLPDGSIKEHHQSEIADLLGCSNTKAHFLMKEAMVELVDTLKRHKANELISTGIDELDEILAVGEIVDSN